jgi:hypothetical protein
VSSLRSLPLSLRTRLLVAATFAGISAFVLLQLLARFASAPDTPFMVVVALGILLVLPVAGLAVVAGWLSTSSDRLGKWVARVLGALAILAQLLLLGAL